MATYLIQVKDGANTIGVIDPITFKNAVYYESNTTGIIVINSTTQIASTAGAAIITPSGDYILRFITQANAQAALAQIYTDLNAYYNA